MSERNGQRPIHVVQVVHSLDIGGTERVVRDVARHFNRDGFRTSVCCLDRLGDYGRELQREGVAIEVLARRPGVDLSLVVRLRRLYRKVGADVVHAHQYTPYFYAASACLLTPPLKVLFTEHGRHQPDRLRLRRVVCNQLLRPVTAGYTAVSEFTRQSLVEFEKMPRSRIRLIYNGIELDSAESLKAGPLVKKDLGLSPGARVVLSVGRMDRIKDFATLLRAVARLAGDVPEAVLLVAGDGDQAYLAELRALAAGLGMNGRVRFLGNRGDVPELLAACDVFALTSVSEAASMTILEAMRAARPVVATDVGGNRELVAPGQTGLLVPAGNAGAVADALGHLLTRPDEAQRMGGAGRRQVSARFSVAGALEEYRRLYCAAARR